MVKKPTQTGLVNIGPQVGDFILGAEASLPVSVRLQSGDWSKYNPTSEKQYVHAKFDTMSCTTFSLLNLLEMQVTYLIKENKLTDEQSDFLMKNKYFDEKDKVNFSEAYIAILSGTTKQGNHFQKVADTVRHYGLIPQNLLPFGDAKTWEEWHDAKRITEEMKKLGAEFLKHFVIGYEWVFFDNDLGLSTEAMKKSAEALQHAPLQVAVPLPGTHAVVCNYMEAYKEWGKFDSYSPHQSKQKWDKQIHYAMKIVIDPVTAPNAPAQPVSQSSYFKVQEFVPKSIYEKYGENAIWFVDPRIQKLANFVRTFFGKPVTINNWSWGGEFNERGFREPDSATGAKLSQHRFGRAIDISIAGMTPKQVSTAVLANERAFMDAGLTCMEDIKDTPTWNHLDIRQTGLDKILIVRA